MAWNLKNLSIRHKVSVWLKLMANRESPAFRYGERQDFIRKRGDKQVLWSEMSYQTYTEDSDNTEPEVWDKCYEPNAEEWLFWINEQ